MSNTYQKDRPNLIRSKEEILPAESNSYTSIKYTNSMAVGLTFKPNSCSRKARWYITNKYHRWFTDNFL